MGERWDRDRFMYERSRDQARFEDDRAYMRGARGGREHSMDERRSNHPLDDDGMVQDRRWYGDEPRLPPRREAHGPELGRRPPGPPVMERERERDYAPPRDGPRRPAFLRRQSSLDTFDRRPRIFQDNRPEYPPPARREDMRRPEYRAPPYTPIPLPKTRGLPPPRRYPDHGFYDDIKVAEPDYYGDDDFRPYPDRMRERDYARSRRHRERSHSRSRTSDSYSTRTRSHRSSSISSATSSRSSSSSGGTTVRSEYPKKGKTRIPAKLVSKRALIDLGYPFFEEGNTIIVQKALGQDNIDELLKVSEDYKKVEAEIQAARSPTQALPPPPPASVKHPGPPPPPPASAVPPPAPAPPKEKKEEKPAPPPEPKEKPAPPPPPPAPVEKTPKAVPPPPPAPPAPIIVDAPAPPVEYFEETYIRDVSPETSSTTSSSWDSHSHHHRRHRRKSIGPVAIIDRRSRSRSRSRGGREIRAEIRALERELAHRPKGGSSREIVHAERLPDGQVVIYEDRVEKIVEHHKPPRIEKDKKGPPPALVRAMLKTLT